jgi:hypothetical protein
MRAGWLALGVLAALLPGQARAYVRTTTEAGKPFVWPNPEITVILYSKDPPPYLTHDTMLNAARQSAATWSYPQVDCTSMMLAVVELDAAEAAVAYDSFNRITFRRVEWRKIPCDPGKESCAPYDSRALAITSVFALKSNGTILDADMELNALHYKWADVAADGTTLNMPGEKVHDLQNTMTHEFGHLIGFDHNCYDPSAGRPRATDNLGMAVPNCGDATPAMRAATMFNSASPLDIDKRDLAPDDIQAVCEVYPKGQAPMPNPTDDDGGGGCALVTSNRGGPGGVGWALLLAAALVGLAIRGRRRA